MDAVEERSSWWACAQERIGWRYSSEVVLTGRIYIRIECLAGWQDCAIGNTNMINMIKLETCATSKAEKIGVVEIVGRSACYTASAVEEGEG